MNKPVIAVVGRPNVGKSTLFNKLIGQRLSIVDDTPGVTRDRIYGEVEWCGKTAFIVDTGGIEPKSDDIILVQMRRQAQLAIDTANVIILVTDCKWAWWQQIWMLHRCSRSRASLLCFV